MPSGSGRAIERAVAWVEERRPDLVLLTGDLLTHPRGEPKLRELAAAPRASHVRGARQPRLRRRARPAHRAPLRLPPRSSFRQRPCDRAAVTSVKPPARLRARHRRLAHAPARRAQVAQAHGAARANAYAVLGNHDFGDAVTLLPRRAGSRTSRRRSCCATTRSSSSCGAGASSSWASTRSRIARARRPGQARRRRTRISASCSATTRTSSTGRAGTLPPRARRPLARRPDRDPLRWGKFRLAHANWRYTKGLYRRGGSALHVSPGLGTTFVPFRFFARPEATELVLRSPS